MEMLLVALCIRCCLMLDMQPCASDNQVTINMKILHLPSPCNAAHVTTAMCQHEEASVRAFVCVCALPRRGGGGEGEKEGGGGRPRAT